MRERYRSAFTKAKVFSAATVAVTADTIVRLGEYKVQAGERITLGYGALSGMDNAVGRIFGKFMDTAGTPVEITGTLRISIWSPQDRHLMTLYEFRTEALNTSATDRTKQTPFPEGPEEVTEDKKYVFEFIADTTGTLSKTNSSFVMDIVQGVE